MFKIGFSAMMLECWCWSRHLMDTHKIHRTIVFCLRNSYRFVIDKYFQPRFFFHRNTEENSEKKGHKKCKRKTWSAKWIIFTLIWAKNFNVKKKRHAIAYLMIFHKKLLHIETHTHTSMEFHLLEMLLKIMTSFRICKPLQTFWHSVNIL